MGDGDGDVSRRCDCRFLGRVGTIACCVLFLIVCDLELIILQMNGGGMKVMMVVMFVCNCRRIGAMSEEID